MNLHSFFDGKKYDEEQKQKVEKVAGYFEDSVKQAEGAVTVLVSSANSRYVDIRVNTKYLLECFDGVNELSEIIKLLYYITIEPQGRELEIFITIENVFIE